MQAAPGWHGLAGINANIGSCHDHVPGLGEEFTHSAHTAEDGAFASMSHSHNHAV